MKVLNIHQREYNQQAKEISAILDTLSSRNDRIWPNEIWPPMILNNGLQINSHGGHGPIGYYVSKYHYGEFIEFTFTKPAEFVGSHNFAIKKISEGATQLRHTIDMELTLKGIFIWYFAIKWLHDALLEDCLDNVHNQFNDKKVHTPHNLWVKTLRNALKRRK